MNPILVIPLATALILTGCAALPELDGPVPSMQAVDFKDSVTPVWKLDFNDPELHQMLAEADYMGLDIVSARARFRAADLALDQVQADNAKLDHSASATARHDELTVDASINFDPDLAGHLDAAIRAATLEHSASELDLLIARRILAREVVLGWIELAKALSDADRADSEVTAEENSLHLLRLRQNAGEVTGSDSAAREQGLIRIRTDAASAQSRIALATARLRALGARTIPRRISLGDKHRPSIPAHTDLTAAQSTPEVCAAWLRFYASDANRAKVLASTRPHLVVTSSLSATAKTLAGLIAGNAAAVTNSVKLEGNILDRGESRRRIDQARLAVAQAEIEWLRARNRAEIAVVDAVAARQTAEAALNAAVAGWGKTRDDLDRIRARQASGVADALELAEAKRNLSAAQREIDQARAEAFRAAVTLHYALPPIVKGCTLTQN